MLPLVPAAFAQSRASAEEQDAQGGEAGLAFGGPDAPSNRISSDRRLSDALIPTDFATPYWAWKNRLLEERGLTFGMEYNSTILTATDTVAGEDELAAGGIFRFSGAWQAVDRNGSSPGALIFLFEHTHSYSDVDVSAFAIQNTGYAGVSNIPHNDDGWRLNTLYWDQKFMDGDLEFIVGFVDITDYVDVYPLVSPWTDFFNLSFSIGAGALDIASDGGLGIAGGAWITDSIYTIAGIADLNANAEQPWRGFKTFVDDHEYFKHFEIGWTGSSKEAYYLDNVHVTLWHTDDRGGVEDGFGGVLSLTHSIGDKWLAYLRAGFANDGGSPLDKSVSIGGGYTPSGLAKLGSGSQLGFGAAWGQPNGAVFGSGLDDQYTFEVYYRLQVTRELAITPSVQLLVEPAINPEQDVVGLFGLRGRLAF
jgi:porin